MSKTYTNSFCNSQLGPKGCTLNHYAGNTDMWFMNCDADAYPSHHAPVCKPDWGCNPPEAQRSYSSCWQDASQGTGLCRSTLHGNQAWLRREGDTDPWVQIDLVSDVSIGGAYFQGRDVVYDSAGNGPLYQWTTSVQIQARADTEPSWTTLGTFSSNTDRSSVVHVTFTPRTARYWRFKPVAYSQYPCLRVALSGEGSGCGGV